MSLVPPDPPGISIWASSRMRIAVAGFLVALVGVLKAAKVVNFDLSSETANQIVSFAGPIILGLVSTYFAKKRVDDGKNPRSPLAPIAAPGITEAPKQRDTKGE